MKTQTLVLLSFLLLLGMVSPALGQMMSGIGVSNGNTFTYRFTCYYNSNNTAALMPPEFSWINQTDYYMMNITGVSGSTINYATTMRMVNGTVIAGTGNMNMGSGVNSMMGFNPMGTAGMNSYFFMYSNTGMMGKMYPSAQNSPTINGTVMMNYPDGQRTTSYMTITTNQNGMMNQTDYYFDQATGAMTQWRQQSIQTSGNLQANSTQILQLTASSVWTVPELSVLFIAPLLFGIAGFIIFIVKKKPFTQQAHAKSILL